MGCAAAAGVGALQASASQPSLWQPVRRTQRESPEDRIHYHTYSFRVWSVEHFVSGHPGSTLHECSRILYMQDRTPSRVYTWKFRSIKSIPYLGVVEYQKCMRVAVSAREVAAARRARRGRGAHSGRAQCCLPQITTVLRMLTTLLLLVAACYSSAAAAERKISTWVRPGGGGPMGDDLTESLAWVKVRCLSCHRADCLGSLPQL